jgi:hypothetical protein
VNRAQWFNDVDRGKLKDSEKNLSQCQFVHHKFHIDHDEKLVTNRLSYGMALTPPYSADVYFLFIQF